MMTKRLLCRYSPGEDWRLAPIRSLLQADLESWVRGRASALGRQVHYVIVEMEWGERRTVTGFGQEVPEEAEAVPKEPHGNGVGLEPIPDVPGQLPLIDDDDVKKGPDAAPSPKEPLGDSEAGEAEAEAEAEAQGEGANDLVKKGPPPRPFRDRSSKKGQRERDDDGASPVPTPT